MTQLKNDLGEKFVRGLKSDFAIVKYTNKEGDKDYTNEEIADSVILNGLFLRLHRYSEKEDRSIHFEVECDTGFVLLVFVITEEAELKIVLTDFDICEPTKIVFGYLLEKVFLEALRNKCKIIKGNFKDSKERLDLMEEVFKTYSYDVLRTANVLALVFDIEKVEIAKKAKVIIGLQDE